MLNEKWIDESEVRIYVMGKEYEVPGGLTIIKAMEYVGYRFIRGCGCRGGFCGACSTVYRMEGDYKLKMDLACQKTVENGMYLVQIPFVPAKKKTFNISKLKSSGSIFLEFYPEITTCISCNTCTKACPQDLEVMDSVQAAVRGDIKEVSELSFDCIQCGLCAIRCPMNIVPYHVAQLARRLYGKYIMPKSSHLRERIRSINEGIFDDEMEKLIHMDLEQLKKEYLRRELEI
jgi:formate hydrogenlyase subunit 6/NADH:ubiquinone oxidoreductase subunit I